MLAAHFGFGDSFEGVGLDRGGVIFVHLALKPRRWRVTVPKLETVRIKFF